MGELAKRVPNVDAWELWNEEDSERFFAGGADPAKYAAMVKSAYPAIKAAQPHDVVVTGATTGNNFAVHRAALRARASRATSTRSATHTDTACLIDGPNRQYREPDGPPRPLHLLELPRGPRGDEAPRGRRQADLDDGAGLGDADHGAELLRRPASTPGKKPLGVTEAQQAEFLTQAYQCLASDPYVGVAFWFGLQDIPGGTSPAATACSARTARAKPAASAFTGALARHRAASACGGVIDKSGPQFTVKAPQDGLVFRKEMGIDVKASDPAASASRASSCGSTASSTATSATATRRCRSSGTRASGATARRTS